MKRISITERVNQLIDLGQRTLATKYRIGTPPFEEYRIDYPLFMEFRSSTHSFIANVFGQTHNYYKDFHNNVRQAGIADINAGLSILSAIKSEIESGWLLSYKGIVSAEIFTDIMDMSEHLLQEGYKDAAAVMIGSVLEGHLKQLCVNNGITVTQNKGGKDVPKKADLMNAELAIANVYNKTEQKQNTANLDLRNNAAHGHYDQYNISQIENMFRSVLDFMVRIPI